MCSCFSDNKSSESATRSQVVFEFLLENLLTAFLGRVAQEAVIDRVRAGK